MTRPKKSKPSPSTKPRRKVLIEIMWDSGFVMNGRLAVVQDAKGYWAENDDDEEGRSGPFPTLETALEPLGFSADAMVSAPTFSDADLKRLLPIQVEDIYDAPLKITLNGTRYSMGSNGRWRIYNPRK